MRQIYFKSSELEAYPKTWFETWWWTIAIGVIFLFTAGVFAALRPVARGNATTIAFEVKQGEGFREVVNDLDAHGLIRHKIVAEGYALSIGAARHLKPGLYPISPSMSTQSIIGQLVAGITREAQVTIPEGSNMYDIDELLGAAGVLPQGEFTKEAKGKKLEGYLFPDTYRFYLNSTTTDVLQKFSDNFEKKMTPLLPSDQKKAKEDLVLASILEKEVPDPHDRQIVAGILLKRIKEGMPLQVDASVCYAKRIQHPDKDCYPVTELDTKISSPYNTYLHQELPPGPIGNPGISALQAALSPVESPYWYYLTDPVTKTTIFSKTLSEHEANRTKYLFKPTL